MQQRNNRDKRITNKKNFDIKDLLHENKTLYETKLQPPKNIYICNIVRKEK